MADLIYRPLYVDGSSCGASNMSIPERVALRARMCRQLGLDEIEMSESEMNVMMMMTTPLSYMFSSGDAPWRMFGLRVVLHE